MPSSRFGAFRRLRTAGLTATVAASLLQACASVGGNPQSPEEIVKQRAEVRWQALLARDWETAYTFSTPAYRSAIDLAGFKARQGSVVSWTSAKVVKVSCQESLCEATIKVGFKAVQRGYPDMDTEFPERWVLEDDRWWVHQKM